MKRKLELLLEDLSLAYQVSDMAATCKMKGRKWGYSLITTSLKPGKPLLLGFNWGAAENHEYQNQTVIKAESFLDQDLGSFRRIVPYSERYIGNNSLVEASQSNYCFFRSKSEKDISYSDLNLCKPVFEKLLAVVEPSMILIFSGKLRDYLIEAGHVSNIQSQEIVYNRGYSEVKYVVKKGIYEGGIRVYFLPHPNYPMENSDREKAWRFCFSE